MLTEAIMASLSKVKSNFKNVPALTGDTLSRYSGCGNQCSGDCAQSCSGGCEAGCSGDCGRGCSGTSEGLFD